MCDDVDGTVALLLAEFGDVGRALSARSDRHRNIVNADAVERLGLIREAVTIIARRRVTELPILHTFSALKDYLTIRLRFVVVEQIYAVFVDRSRRLIHDEVISSGSIDEAPLYTQALFHRALDLGAAGVFLAHNHPAGDSSPSMADRAITAQIARAGRAIEVPLLDHLIVGRNGITSMVAAGLL